MKRRSLMRRRRFQKPRVKNKGGYWIAQYRDQEGRKRKVSLGPVWRTKKYDAEGELTKILESINGQPTGPSPHWRFGYFVRQVYLPFYRRKWKSSTASSNEDRLRNHLTAVFEEHDLSNFARSELQNFLDAKAAAGLSHSVVAHLRWDLRQVFQMAVSEGYLERNPAELLFVPREARRPQVPSMTVDQVKSFFSVLDLRERVIGGLAIIAGMRPGEILALRRSHVEKGYADIRQRIYRGQIDTPKTFNSTRWAAFGDGLSTWLRGWVEMLPYTSPEAWLFPSEKLTTPIIRENCWRRGFRPRLKPVGLQWANFQVMRRTHSCLLDELGVDPQVRADQMGHSVDVNQNRYTRSSLERRRTAVNALEKALGVM
jgi:integrase